MIQNVYGLSLDRDNVFELSLNASGFMTFKNENVENDFFKNLDETFDESILIDWMKTFQSHMIKRSANTEHRNFSEWFRNFITRFKILPVTRSGFRRFMISWIDWVIYRRSRPDFPQSISSFFFTYWKTKERRKRIKANASFIMQPVKESSLSRFL